MLKEYDDAGNKIKPRSFVSFYDYNRTTCGWLKYIFGADIHTYRRIVWIIVFCTGFIYSVLVTVLVTVFGDVRPIALTETLPS